MQQSGLTAFDFFEPVDETEYGIDEEGMVPDVENSTRRIALPQQRLNLSPEHL